MKTLSDEDIRHVVSRRELLAGLAALSLNLYLPLQGSGLKGSQVNVLYLKGVPEEGVLESSEEEVREASGLKISIKAEEYSGIADIIRRSQTSSVSPYDVIWVDDVWLYGFARNNYLTPLSAFARRDIPDFDEAFLPAVRNSEALLSREREQFSIHECSLSRTECELWMIPQRVDVQVLYYNRRIFNDPGIRSAFRKRTGTELTIPATWPQYEAVASGIHRLKSPTGTVIGCAETLGVPHYCLDFFVSRFWSMLPLSAAQEQPDLFRWSRDRVEPTFGGQAGVEAIEHFRKLRSCWADGSESAGHTQTIARFAVGDVAMCPQWYTYHASSELGYALGDDLGVALLPGMQYEDRIRRTPSIGGGGLAIPVNAKDPEKSWAFIRYVSGEGFNRSAALRGAVSARQQVHLDTEVKNRFPSNMTYLQSIETAVRRPRLRNFTHVEALLGRHLNNAIVDPDRRPVSGYLKDATDEILSALEPDDVKGWT